MEKQEEPEIKERRNQSIKKKRTKENTGQRTEMMLWKEEALKNRKRTIY